MDKQPTIPELDIKSPIFTPRPGWGGKMKKWFKKNWRPYILPGSISALVTMGIYKLLSQ